MNDGDSVDRNVAAPRILRSVAIQAHIRQNLRGRQVTDLEGQRARWCAASAPLRVSEHSAVRPAQPTETAWLSLLWPLSAIEPLSPSCGALSCIRSVRSRAVAPPAAHSAHEALGRPSFGWRAKTKPYPKRRVRGVPPSPTTAASSRERTAAFTLYVALSALAEFPACLRGARWPPARWPRRS
jgi:hypothetical protein